MSPANIDRLVAVGLILLGVMAILPSRGFPGDAGVFPTAMGILLILASLLLMVQGQLRKAKPVEPGDPPDLARFLTWIGLAGLLLMMISRVDFYLGLFTFIVLSYLTLARRSLIFSIAVGGVFTAALFVGFDMMLGVPTPRGLLR